MKIVVDEKKLARNGKLARGIVLGVVAAAMGLMIAVLLGATSPAFRAINPAFILLGEIVIIVVMFAIARIGFIFAGRYLSMLRPEKVFRDSLKGLDRKFTLMLFEKPTDYMLVEPGGITVLVPRPQETPVRYQNGKWQGNRTLMRTLMGRDEALGDPHKDATNAMLEIKKRLDANAPDIKVPLRAAIVFVHPAVKLDVEPGPIPVLRADQLKDYIRNGSNLKELPKSIQRKMRAAIGAPDMLNADE